MMLVGWIFLIALAIWFVKDDSLKKPVLDEPELILTERYLHGEIDEKTYKHMKSVIKQDQG